MTKLLMTVLTVSAVGTVIFVVVYALFLFEVYMKLLEIGVSA